MMHRTLALLALLAISAYADEEAVLKLNDDNFNEALSENEHIMVEFFAPWCGHCKRLDPEYKEAAASLDKEGSTIKMAQFDCTQEKKSTCSAQGIRGFPTMKTFVKGQEFEKYTGPRTAADISKYLKDVKDGKVTPKAPEAAPPSRGDSAGDKKVIQNLQEQIKTLQKRVDTLEGKKPASNNGAGAPAEEDEDSEDVLVLTDSNFDEGVKEGLTLVEFYAPWCGHCKRLQPDYNAAAAELKDEKDLTFAKVDCTVEKETAQKYAIRGYPTIKLFYNGEDKEEYNRPRTIDSLTGFMKDSRAKYGSKDEL